RGQAGSLADWLPREDPPRTAAILELARVEIRYRIGRGEAARAEEYLARYPELAERAESAVGLVIAEYEARREREADLDLQEYAVRFPPLANHADWIKCVSHATRACDACARPGGTRACRSTATRGVGDADAPLAPRPESPDRGDAGAGGEALRIA